MKIEDLKIGFLKVEFSEPQIGMMYNTSSNRFIEVFEVNKLEGIVKYKNMNSDECLEEKIDKAFFSVFVVSYKGNSYSLHKSQWVINRKNKNNEVLFVFARNRCYAKIWNLTLSQQAELMGKYNSAMETIKNNFNN